jgi:glutathione S-transferase
MTPPLTLVSHALCPYVQRAAIVLTEKGVAFTRRDVDLAHKPDWFLQVSPLARTPVLLVGEEPLFESAVICEYLDEVLAPRLHPGDALSRARQRAWMEFGSAVLATISAFYRAPDEAALAASARELRERFARVEASLGEGPYFAGAAFGMVDAVFGPVFRYFDAFDRVADFGILAGLPKVAGWRATLAARASVRGAVRVDYPDLLWEFLRTRGSALAHRIAALPPATGSAGALSSSARRR